MTNWCDDQNLLEINLRPDSPQKTLVGESWVGTFIEELSGYQHYRGDKAQGRGKNELGQSHSHITNPASGDSGVLLDLPSCPQLRQEHWALFFVSEQSIEYGLSLRRGIVLASQFF